MTAPTLVLAAWGFELLLGWPDWLYRRVGHPVVWIGKVIDGGTALLNRASYPDWLRYSWGAALTLLIAAGVGVTTFTISQGLPDSWWGWVIEGLIASSLLASRSLYSHVRAVAVPLASGDITIARRAVSHIVGRDPNQLDGSAISRASLESLAENMSDGVVAPLFWGCLFGLPGLATYKAINTLDSMIGHRTKQLSAFGGFAARLDDLANLVPARLTGVLLATASGRWRAFTIMWRDARHHRSPNAGWPEAAMAGALNVRLSGPRRYGTQWDEQPWLNPGKPDPDAEDIEQGLRLYRRALCLGAFLLTSGIIGVYFAI